MIKFLFNKTGELYVILCYMFIPLLSIYLGFDELKDMAVFYYSLLCLVFIGGTLGIDVIPQRPIPVILHITIFGLLATLLILAGYAEPTSYINLKYTPCRLSVVAFMITSIFIAVSSIGIVFICLLVMILLYLWLWVCKGSKPDIKMFPSFRKK